MSERHGLARRTPIQAVERLLDIGPNTVHVGDDLIDVARRAFARPQTRILCVLDEEQRLIGLLPVLRIVEEVVARVAPEELMADITSLEAAGRFGREIAARTAADLMLPPRALRPDDTVGDAFAAMREERLSGLPVVDEESRVTGYVDLLELALQYLEELERTPSA
ncbi:MAG: hypothetical protein A2X23_13360 [Chloroflexi bacterium GWC2_73_18]|nr:MAG: hypothetical protein A2X23_13360 [Chloroflexi bacterium GWC2_73_18]